MKEKKTYRIVIGGGGTGGHIFPAISIANALKGMLDDVDILFVGARGKIEMTKVPEAGYEIVGLPVAGFQRRLSWKNITFFFKLFQSMLISRKLIRKFNPDIAIGVGGYASGPIVKAASRKKIPILIQEQNSYAGVTNRLLAKAASTICVAYSGMEKYFPAEKVILTGNPIRQDLLMHESEKENSFKHFKLDPARKVILLVGGSLGARTLNMSIIENLERLEEEDVQIIWQCGSYYYEEARKILQEKDYPSIRLMPFIKEMNRAFQVADLIISRAGAGTISELCLIGKPVILVPSPNVAEDHQTSNARSLSDQKAAVLIPDKEAREKLIPEVLSLVKDKVRTEILSTNIKKLAIKNSAELIAKEVIKLVK